jgi:transglycosylase-like protein with SLT domain
MVSRANTHILRLTNARLQDLVVSDWAARAVLRYWRLQRRCNRVLEALRGRCFRPSLHLLGHALVIGLGFVLVVPAMNTSATTPRLVAAEYSGHVLLVNPDRGRNAVEMREIPKAHTMEERPAPAVIALPNPTVATRVATRPTPAAPKVFTPPPGSGGDGLAAIYAVFGNSPGLSWALRVANCESHYNPLAINRSSGASGLFQFMPSTWNANFLGQNIWDPYAQARGALVFYNAGRQSAWTCK